MLYLSALIIFFIIPGTIMFIYLHKKEALPLKPLIIATILFATIILPADWYMVYKGVWTFGPEHMVGIWWLGMPFEEYLFYFTAIPAIMLFFELVRYLIVRKK